MTEQAENPGAFVVRHCRFGTFLTLEQIAQRDGGLLWLYSMQVWEKTNLAMSRAIKAFLGQSRWAELLKLARAQDKERRKARSRVGPFRSHEERQRAECNGW